MVLYHTARDVVDVFRAIVPTLFGSTINAVPRLALLFHNDCLYIAHSLVAIGHEFRQRYGVAVTGSCRVTAHCLAVSSDFCN